MNEKMGRQKIEVVCNTDDGRLQMPVVAVGDSVLSLRTLYRLDEVIEGDFDRLLADLIAHCRKFAGSEGVRELVLSLRLQPGDTEEETKILARCEASYPKVKSAPVDLDLTRNKSNQLLLPLL